MINYVFLFNVKKVQLGKDQEKTQSEKDSQSIMKRIMKRVVISNIINYNSSITLLISISTVSSSFVAKHFHNVSCVLHVSI